jgi:hypothetical protein
MTKEDKNKHSKIKTEIIEALTHPEAEEGLYFRNLMHLHEEDERNVVSGNEDEILFALKELIDEGKVKVIDQEEDLIFSLSNI